MVDRVRWLAGLLLVAIAGAALQLRAGPENDPTAIVEQLQASLLQVMREAGQLGYQGRYARLAPVIEASHGLSRIARVAVGRYWKKLDAEQQAVYVKTFIEFSIATYARRFDSYSGETFQIDSQQQTAANQAVVRTALVKTNGEQVSLDYILRRVDGRWRIINIIADGVSDLALKRAEYTSMIRRRGIDALIAELRAKITRYAKDG